MEVRKGSHRAYSYRELVALIEAGGFRIERDPSWTRDMETVSFITTRTS